MFTGCKNQCCVTKSRYVTKIYQYPFLHPIVVLLYIKEQIFRHTQYIYIINSVELNSGQHVSITHDHLQVLVDTFLILKQSYM
jgi:hypothetical protein